MKKALFSILLVVALLATIVLAFAETSYPDLHKGSKGDDVKALQTRLFELGFYSSTIDGDYGNGTEKAIKAFELTNGLEETGIATPELQELMFSDQAKRKEIAVSALKVNTGSKSASVVLGSTLNVSELVSVSPENASEKGLLFALDSDEFATIDESGILTPVAKGDVTVTITSKENVEKPKSTTLKVKVCQPVETITLDESSFSIDNGKTHKLSATIGPEVADNKGVTWSSDQPEIATVTKDGTVKGVGTGTATITCTASDGSGISASAEVTVITIVKKITLSGKSMTLIDDDTVKLKAEVSPENATDLGIIWSSSDESVASFDATGRLQAKESGTCVVTATAKDGSGVSAEMTIYVEPHLPIYVSSIHWQTTWGQKNGKMGVEAENLCNNSTIKAFDYTVVCSSFMTSATSYLTYEGPSIKPGKTGKSRLTKSTVSGFSNAYQVEITPTKVYFADGTEMEIPSAYRYTSTFTM